MHLTLCAFVTFQEHISYLLTAIRASFGKIRAQEHPNSLLPDAFPGLQICQNCFCSRSSAPDLPEGAYGAPQTYRSWIKGGLLLRGGEGGDGRGGKGKGRGTKIAPPFSNSCIGPWCFRMQYDDVTPNPIWRTAAILKIVFWLYLRDLLTD